MTALAHLFTDPLADYRRVEGRTLSFFAPNDASAINIDQRMLDALIAESLAKQKINARICLHTSPEAPFHGMVVLEWQGSYFPPHRHPTKSETIQIIKGELGTMAFREDGVMCFHKLLGKDRSKLVHFGIGQWHFTVPVSKYVIYVETKLGPFLGESDREFAPWAAEREAELRGAFRT